MSETPPFPIGFYREKPQARPVDPHWKCLRSGDCCSLPAEVSMTREERAAILPKIPQGIKTEWRDAEDPRFVVLKAHPCPFFIFGECVVYDVRPYNCRRFACLRPDPHEEAFEFEHSPSKVTGCKNADDRFYTSREARRLLVHIQQKAMRWARAHGWSEDDA